jgi:hypothetical protein
VEVDERSKRFGVVYIVVLSPPSTEEIGSMGREIESRQGIGRVVAIKKSFRTVTAFKIWRQNFFSAVVLGIHLTNGVSSLGRFPINFKSEVPSGRIGGQPKYFYHVVLGLALGHRPIL